MKMLIFSITVALLFGCVSRTSPPKEDTAKEAPVPSSFIERDGVRIPLYDLSQIHPSHLARPEYPNVEKEKKLFGDALIRVFVTPEGKIEGLEIRKSEPCAAVGDSALKAVSQWYFPVLKKDGLPISYLVDVPVIFAPEGTPILREEMKTEPNQSPERTLAPVTPAAGQPARQA